MARVFIGVGHGGRDPGTVAGGLQESEVNLVMALAMKDTLERYGVTVGISRVTEENDPLAQEIAEANSFGADAAVEVHNNAGGGDGFEVYHQTGKYREQSMLLAREVEREVKAIGQNSRGLKTKLNSSGGDWFGWLRQLNCPAVLCEGAFLDNRNDVKIIDTIEKQQAFGIAYAKGVLDYLGISQEVPEPPAAESASLEEVLALLRQQGIPTSLDELGKLLQKQFNIEKIEL